MGHVDRQLELLEDIARLRRAQQRLPDDADLSAARASLERQLGETVSGRVAARFLGLSHTALQRWVGSGDLVLVETPRGRRQVSVSSLLALGDEVERTRRQGRGHPLEPQFVAGRDRAERLDPTQFDDGDRSRYIALAYHRAVAPRLNRALVKEARHRVRRWRDQGRMDPRYSERWLELLGRPLPEIRERISADDDDGHDLRQNSPFAGILSEPERRRVIAAAG